MKKYLLPCSCGQKLEVDASQAGLAVPCTCGATVEVPTMRGLSQLETVEAAPAMDRRGASAAEGSSWGPAQGLMFLGALLLVVGAGATALVYNGRPIVEVNKEALQLDTDRLTPEQSWEMWLEARQGLDRSPTPISEEFQKALEVYHRYLGLSIAVLVIGLLLALAGLAMWASRRRPSP